MRQQYKYYTKFAEKIHKYRSNIAVFGNVGSDSIHEAEVKSNKKIN
jgi:hypothetical protein